MDRGLKKNIFSLTILQLGNFVVPLLTLPWLTRVLGPNGFGRLGFAAAIISYFILLTEWGFNLGATRDIAIAKDQSKIKFRIFWEVIFARAALGLCGALILAVLVYLIPRFQENALLLSIGFIGVFASVLSPVFYLQGVERVSSMVGINLVVKFLSVPLIFIFVQSTDSLFIAAFIQAMVLLGSASANLWVLMRSGEIPFVLPNLARVMRQIHVSSSLFLSNAAISLYTNSSTVILGFVASDAAVGVFVAAYTVVRAALGLMGPISQALFPRISFLLNNQREQAEQLLGRVFLLQAGIGLLFTLLLAGVSPFVVELLFGKSFGQSLAPLWCLSTLPFLIAISSVLGTQIMVPLGHNLAFSAILIVAGVVNVILAFPFGAIWGALGAALSMVVAEVVVTCIMIYFVKTRESRVWSQLI